MTIVMPTKFQQIIMDIECAEQQKVTRFFNIQGVELAPIQHLIQDLSGNYGALLVRTLLSQLAIDESYIFQWRLENKYIQYQILNFYAPGSMPHSIGLSELLNESEGLQRIKDLFSSGYFLKATLGDASFATKSWDKTNDFEKIIKEPLVIEEYEKFIIQKKLRLRREFRVHSFCKQVIPLLTYRIPNTQHFNFDDEAEEFVEDVLSKLPNQITEGTLIAWDIGLTTNDKLYVIEANFTGFHPEYRRGFQTTGYVDNHPYGTIICAWINSYFKKYYRIGVDSIDPVLVANFPFYRDLMHYCDLFDQNCFDRLFSTNDKLTSLSAVMYVNDAEHLRSVNLLNHFLNVDLAEKYYVVVTPSTALSITALFKRPNVKIVHEIELLTPQQYQAFMHMGYDRRKLLCYHHISRKFKNKAFINI
jgi:hypothetical protein